MTTDQEMYEEQLRTAEAKLVRCRKDLVTWRRRDKAWYWWVPCDDVVANLEELECTLMSLIKVSKEAIELNAIYHDTGYIR